MKINIVENVTEMTYKSLLPYVRYKWLKNTLENVLRVVMISVSEDDVVNGYCIIVINSNTDISATLLYIEVLEKDRGRGIGEFLLKHTITQVHAWGFKSIVAGIVGDEPYGILSKLSFEMVSTEYTQVYKAGTIKNSKAGSNRALLLPLTKRVKRICELDLEQKKAFREKILKRRFGLDIERCNQNLSRCYLNSNNEVIAIMNICRNEDGDLVNAGTYILKVEEAKLALPSMIADILIKEDDSIFDENELVLTFGSARNVEAMKSSFGIPNREVKTTVYMLSDIHGKM